jgi:hypothetical protein
MHEHLSMVEASAQNAPCGMSMSVPITRRGPLFHRAHEFCQHTSGCPYFCTVAGRSS